jgi:hypothetical protein
MAKAARFTALAAVAVLAAVAPASARTRGLHVSSAPRHALQGTNARISVTVRPAGAACTLRLRYHDGSYQQGLARVVARGGLASWTWTVPTTVQAGQALATVRCGRAGSLTRTLVVVGRLIAPKIVVQQSGYSVRPGTTSGARLSYGLILHNASPTQDATSVTVQTNFVLADDHLLGTDTHTISTIGAGADYALGNTVSFPGAAPIARLEVVIQTGGFARHTLHLPTLANIHLVPGQFDPSWLGKVEGELQNTDPALTLRSATLSAVVFDQAGNILGGGNGFAFAALPPGAREFLSLGNGFDVIPMEKAAQARVSITPSWQQASG